MPYNLSRPRIILAKVTDHLVGLRADQRGTVAVLMALLLPVLIGVLGIGFEISNWYLQTRSMQNAADLAAIAAAYWFGLQTDADNRIGSTGGG